MYLVAALTADAKASPCDAKAPGQTPCTGASSPHQSCFVMRYVAEYGSSLATATMQ